MSIPTIVIVVIFVTLLGLLVFKLLGYERLIRLLERTAWCVGVGIFLALLVMILETSANHVGGMKNRTAVVEQSLLEIITPLKFW